MIFVVFSSFLKGNNMKKIAISALVVAAMMVVMVMVHMMASSMAGQLGRAVSVPFSGVGSAFAAR